MSKTSGSAVARRRSLIQSAAFETLERRLVFDAEPSHVLSSEFQWISQQSLEYTFDLEAERMPSQVYLANLLTGQQYFGLGDDIVGPSYTESFPIAGPALGDGYYEAVLRGASSAEESEAIDDYSSTFFFLAGDTNHDGSVDDDDQDVYTTNYGGEGPFDFTQGDFNYDGMVDDADGDILAARYGTVLEPPPDAPNTLVLNTLGPRQITFTWQAPEGITPDGFKIFRSSDGGETDPYTLYKTINDGSATSWQENNVPDGAKYYYRVRAFRTDYGNSITTNAESIVTSLPAPDELSVSNVGATKVRLNWRDQSNNESGYEIWAYAQWAAEEEPQWMQLNTAPGGAGGVSGGVHSFLVSGLSPDTSYAFRIRAVTAAQTSIWSSEVTATTLLTGVPDAPANVWTSLIDDTSATVSWFASDSSEVTGYSLFQLSTGNAPELLDTVAPTATSYSVTGLAPQSDYSFQVQANNTTEGEDSALATSDAITTLFPGQATAPADVTFTPGGRSVTVEWADSSDDEIGFNVEQFDENTDTWTIVASATANATSAEVDDLDSDTVYGFRVIALSGQPTQPEEGQGPQLPPVPDSPGDLEWVATDEGDGLIFGAYNRNTIYVTNYGVSANWSATASGGLWNESRTLTLENLPPHIALNVYATITTDNPSYPPTTDTDKIILSSGNFSQTEIVYRVEDALLDTGLSISPHDSESVAIKFEGQDFEGSASNQVGDGWSIDDIFVTMSKKNYSVDYGEEVGPAGAKGRTTQNPLPLDATTRKGTFQSIRVTEDGNDVSAAMDYEVRPLRGGPKVAITADIVQQNPGYKVDVTAGPAVPGGMYKVRIWLQEDKSKFIYVYVQL
jgi:hypothetical protein